MSGNPEQEARHAPAPTRLDLALYAALGLALVVLAAAAFRGRPGALALAAAVAAAWILFDARTSRDLAPVAGGSALSRLGPPALVFLATAAVCAPTLGGDFLGDDFGYVRLFYDLPFLSALRPGDISHGIWGHPLDELRPVFAASFKLGLLLHGPSAFGFHATNVLLHAANSLLIYALARVLAPGRRRTALAAGLIFGLMPVHAEPIAWLTGKVDSLPAFFYLAAFLLFARFRASGRRPFLVSAWAVYAVGVFAKEVLLTLPLMLIAWEAVSLREVLSASAGRAALPGGARPSVHRLARETALVHAPFWLVAGTLLVARRLVFTSFAREGRLTRAAVESFLARQPEKLRWLLAPMAGDGLPATLALAAMIGLLAGCAWTLWRRRRRYAPALRVAGFFGPAWYAITLLPLIVTYPSERHLYLPSCGAAMALAALLFPPAAGGSTRSGPLRVGAALGVIALYGWTLRAENGAYVEAGRFSREARAQVEAALGSVPPGATLVLSGFPDMAGRRLVWRFALPFALQPPFAGRDLYAPYRVFEPPGLYSRPLAWWWRDKRPLLAALLDGDPAESLELYSVHWNERRGALVLHRSRRPRGELRAHLERAVGAPPDALQEIDARRARRLLAALAESARLGSEPVGGPATEPAAPN